MIRRRHVILGGVAACATARASPRLTEEEEQDANSFARHGQLTCTVFGSGGTHTIDTIGTLPERSISWTGSEEAQCRKRQPYQGFCELTESVVAQADAMYFMNDDVPYRGRLITVLQAIYARGGRGCDGPNHRATASFSSRGIVIVPRASSVAPIFYAQLLRSGYAKATLLPAAIQVFNNANNALLATEAMTINTLIPLTKRFSEVQVPEGGAFRVEIYANTAFDNDLHDESTLQGHRYTFCVMRKEQ